MSWTEEFSNLLNSLAVPIGRFGAHANKPVKYLSSIHRPDSQEPGYFEKNFKIKIKEKLINNWLEIGMSCKSSERRHETYKYKLPYGNGNVVIHSFSSVIKFKNWLHDNIWDDRPLMVRKYIKAVGKKDAINQLRDINFLFEVKHCVPDLKLELEKIITSLKYNEFIIITHEKDFHYQ